MRITLTLVETEADLEPAIEAAAYTCIIQPMEIGHGSARAAFEVFVASFSNAVEHWEELGETQRDGILGDLSEHREACERLGLSIHQAVTTASIAGEHLPLAVLTAGADARPRISLVLDAHFEIDHGQITRH